MPPKKRKSEDTIMVESTLKLSRNDFSVKTQMDDLTLIVENKTLYVSRSVLTLVSPVFTKMFESDFKEKNQEEISLNEKKYDDVLQLLRCVYPDILEPVSMKNVFTVLPLADEYQVERLKADCEKVLLSATHTHTSAIHLCQYISLACLYNLYSLEEECILLASKLSQRLLNLREKKYPIPLSAKCKIQEKMITLLENKNINLQEKNTCIEREKSCLKHGLANSLSTKCKVHEDKIKLLEDEKTGLKEQNTCILREKACLQDTLTKANASRMNFYMGGYDVPEGVLELRINNVRKLPVSFTLHSPKVTLRDTHWYIVVNLSNDGKHLQFRLVLYEKPVCNYKVQAQITVNKKNKPNDEEIITEMEASFSKKGSDQQLHLFPQELLMSFIETPGNRYVLGETLYMKAHILVKKVD